MSEIRQKIQAWMAEWLWASDEDIDYLAKRIEAALRAATVTAAGGQIGYERDEAAIAAGLAELEREND